jgi:autophagy-related protein 5
LQEAAEHPEQAIDVVETRFEAIREDDAPNTLGDLLESLGLTAPGRAVVHGVEPGLETPLQWMATHLAHPDNILHVVWLENAA